MGCLEDSQLKSKTVMALRRNVYKLRCEFVLAADTYDITAKNCNIFPQNVITARQMILKSGKTYTSQA